jgi:Ala-tRNA(Pro) deacylase
MILTKLKDFLDQQKIKYAVITHSEAFTAEEIAVTSHVPKKEIAKTVIVKLDDKMTMAVVPATDMVDLRLLKKSLGATKAELASEDEFKDRFPQCEVGAMPPFGNLFDMDVIIADDFTRDGAIVFNAGTHRDLVRMAYRDFERLVQPRIAAFSVVRKSHADDWNTKV